ncbi:MFS general substrate transporter [Dendrothele bispora CBS 962.96]|uniref:MFS general substrate transporter n=1 Tax=Dendrothele bispora (strain CBS 962.96) TaxID=1314807 RepID=A0A4S8MDT7_DENBC|nr:MFS general substrate transporter [Dendrothele bispora CBS 962.96]
MSLRSESRFDSEPKEKDFSAEDVKLEVADDRVSTAEPNDSWFLEERKLVRKLDGRILPIACLLYLFAYLDRSNLGNARNQGLPADVLHGDPTGVLFDWVNSAFFFSYILCQVPATVMSKLVAPRIWLAGAAIGWGICSTLMSTTFNFGGMLVTRIFLGVFEAGFGPAIPLYFSLFYTKQEMGLRMAYWFGFAAVAGAFGGIIAFGIQHAQVDIEQWRLLFIVEGSPAVMLGVVSYFLLPDRPESTGFFNEREREIVLGRMNRATSGDVGATVNKAHIRMALKDWRIYTGGIIYFGLNAALASTSAFLPTILQDTLGYSAANSQLMTVPPYAVAAVVLTMFSWFSDRYQTRGIPIAIASSIGAIGYLLNLVSTNGHVRYFGVFCITSGTYTGIGIIIAWFAHNLGSETKKATGIPMFMAIGQCGSVTGSHIFPKTDQPRYIKGFAIVCALEFFAALCALILSVSYRWDNSRRDKLHGVPKADSRVDVSEHADKAPNFRYVH